MLMFIFSALFLFICAVCIFLWVSVELSLFSKSFPPRDFAPPRYTMISYMLLFSLVASSKFPIEKTPFDENASGIGLPIYRWFVWFFGLLIANLSLYLWWSTNWSIADPFIKDERRFALILILMASSVIFSRCIVRKKIFEGKPVPALEIFIWLSRLASLSVLGTCLYMWLQSDLSRAEQYILAQNFQTILLLGLFSSVSFAHSNFRKELDREKAKPDKRPLVIKYLEKIINESIAHFVLWVSVFLFFIFRF